MIRIVLRGNPADASIESPAGATSGSESESSGNGFGWVKDGKFDANAPLDPNAKPGDLAAKYQRYPSLGSPNNQVSTPFYFNIG